MLVYIGMILLAFGVVSLAISFLGSLNGVRNELGWTLAIVGLVGGAILTVAGRLGGRSGTASAGGR